MTEQKQMQTFEVDLQSLAETQTLTALWERAQQLVFMVVEFWLLPAEMTRRRHHMLL